jgi:hypothetical protein
MKQKVGSLEQLTGSRDPYPTWQNKREKTHSNKIRGKKGDKTTNTKKIQKIIRGYFEKLYSCKLENLDEMCKFLDACNQPKLNQEDINYLNSHIICNEIETIIESPYKEEPRTWWIHGQILPNL